jgi:hypothetical protein
LVGTLDQTLSTWIAALCAPGAADLSDQNVVLKISAF